MTKSEKERISLLEQYNSFVEDEFSEIKEMLKEMLKEIRDNQKNNETNGADRHQEALKADQIILNYIKENYVSREWLKTVGLTIGTIWSIIVFFAGDAIRGIFNK